MVEGVEERCALIMDGLARAKELGLQATEILCARRERPLDRSAIVRRQAEGVDSVSYLARQREQEAPGHARGELRDATGVGVGVVAIVWAAIIMRIAHDQVAAVRGLSVTTWALRRMREAGAAAGRGEEVGVGHVGQTAGGEDGFAPFVWIDRRCHSGMIGTN